MPKQTSFKQIIQRAVNRFPGMFCKLPEPALRRAQPPRLGKQTPAASLAQYFAVFPIHKTVPVEQHCCFFKQTAVKRGRYGNLKGVEATGAGNVKGHLPAKPIPGGEPYIGNGVI